MTTPPIYIQCENRIGYYQGNVAGIAKETPKGYRINPLIKLDFDSERKAKNAAEKYAITGDRKAFDRAVKQ